MANIYYGDNLTSTTDGDWNNTNNWYVSLGFQIGCCCVGGAQAGRVPNGTTDTVWFTATGGVKGITTGPSAVTWPNGYPGTINLVFDSTSVQRAVGFLAAGTYSGLVNVRAWGAAGFDTEAIRAGTTFTGTVVRPSTVDGAGNQAWISGGTYKPGPVSCAYIPATGRLDPTNIPTDPGFKAAGGAFLPVINVTGIP